MKIFSIDYENPTQLVGGLISGFEWSTAYVLAENAKSAEALLAERLIRNGWFKRRKEIPMETPQEIDPNVERVLVV